MLLLILILAVHDGDTLMVNLPCNVPQVCNKMPIRINGIDTPELLDPRPEIRAIAQKARARTIELTSSSTTMHIVGRDKYFRLDADLFDKDGYSIAATLVKEGLARPYKGVGPKPW